jgi:hypothetical protein
VHLRKRKLVSSKEERAAAVREKYEKICCLLYNTWHLSVDRFRKEVRKRAKKESAAAMSSEEARGVSGREISGCGVDLRKRELRR